MKRLLVLFIMTLVAVVFVGCSNPLTGSTKSVFTDPGVAAKIMAELKDRSEFKGKDIKVFQNVVITESPDTGIFIDINILKPGTTDQVDNYKYRGNSWTGPTPVQITGKGNMADNVAPFDAIDYSKLPDIYKICDEKAKTIEKGAVKRTIVYILRIDSGTYEGIISIKGAREEHTATFDGKGNLKSMKKD